MLMSGGQILFKLAAGRVREASLTIDTLVGLTFNPYLLSGLVVYGITTVVWVLLLVEGDLSRSYPFTALTMVLVPLAGGVLFSESISPNVIIGGGVILLGLAILAYG